MDAVIILFEEAKVLLMKVTTMVGINHQANVERYKTKLWQRIKKVTSGKVWDEYMVGQSYMN